MLVTLDFETPFSKDYTLAKMTYEEYILDPRFKVFMCGIKEGDAPTYWLKGDELTERLQQLFPPNNLNTCVCHNALFDGAILGWVYDLHPFGYVCTKAMADAAWPTQSSSLAEVCKRLWPHDESRRKGTELMDVKGLFDLTTEQEKVLGGYCINDVDLTYLALMEMAQWFPTEELELISLTQKMFTSPHFVADIPQLEEYQAKLERDREQLLDETVDSYDFNGEVDIAAEAWRAYYPADCPFTMIQLAEKYPRIDAHLSGLKPFKTPPKYKAMVDYWDEQGDERPLVWLAHAFTMQRKKQPIEKIVSSAPILASFIHAVMGVKVAIKDSPTRTNPDNKTYALAKNDLEFIDLRKKEELGLLLDCRIAFSSTGELGRVKRLISHATLNKGRLAVPLKYYGAQATGRWSGTNSVNFQNFKRGSPLRTSLQAPEGYLVHAGDLSNIEGRVLAAFADADHLLAAYAEGRDLYSELATDIFERPVDRKRIEVDANGNEYEPDEMEGFVGKVATLGLGYGMGWVTFWRTLAKGAMGSAPLILPDAVCQKTVQIYRTKNWQIAELWKEADVIIAKMMDPDVVPHDWRGLTVGHCRLDLPNGMALQYPGLRVGDEEDEYGRRGYVYWNGDYWKSIYGGLLIENIVQALSRIIIGQQMLATDGYLRPLGGRVVLTVHDEIVSLIPKANADDHDRHILTLMRKRPGWAHPDLVLDAESKVKPYYAK